MCAKFHGNFFAIEHKRLFLEVWLPDFFGVAHREADVASVLFAFAGEFTFLHICPSYDLFDIQSPIIGYLPLWVKDIRYTSKHVQF